MEVVSSQVGQIARYLGEGDSTCLICIWNLFICEGLETYKMSFYLIKCGLTIWSSILLKRFAALLHQIKDIVQNQGLYNTELFKLSVAHRVQFLTDMEKHTELEVIGENT